MEEFSENIPNGLWPSFQETMLQIFPEIHVQHFCLRYKKSATICFGLEMTFGCFFIFLSIFWYLIFLSDPGIPGVRSMGVWVSETNWLYLVADLTDVTLADGYTNSVLTDNANRARRCGNASDTIWLPTLEWKWLHLMNKFWTSLQQMKKYTPKHCQRHNGPRL